MSWRLVIDMQFDSNQTHRFRNFGEDVFRLSRNDGSFSVPWDQVDGAKNQLVVTVGSRSQVSRIRKLIGDLLDEHFPISPPVCLSSTITELSQVP